MNLDRDFTLSKLNLNGDMVVHYVQKKPRHVINFVGVETPVYSRKEGRIVVSLPRMVDAKGW
jgi:hypothetical protein